MVVTLVVVVVATAAVTGGDGSGDGGGDGGGGDGGDGDSDSGDRDGDGDGDGGGPAHAHLTQSIFAPKSDLVWGFLDHPQAVRDLIATYPFKFDPTDGAEIMGGLSEVRATDELVFSRISRAFLSFYHSYIRRVIRSRILMGG